jgi:hypothetical protein
MSATTSPTISSRTTLERQSFMPSSFVCLATTVRVLLQRDKEDQGI